MFRFGWCHGAALLAVGCWLPAWAADVDLATGGGTDYAELVVHFSDDAQVTFGVTFDAVAESWTGTDLVAFVADASGGRYLDGSDTSTFTPPADFGQHAGLDVVFQTFDFGSGPSTFFDGFGTGGSSDIGFAGGEDYWHFWQGSTGATAPSGWAVSNVGTSSVAVVDGGAFGFRYGSALAPLEVPEPGTALLLIAGGLAISRRRRHG
ncbi:MAG: PEP-CTERM sorting domain-containing protein [Planctomycetota bacterium]